MIQINLFLSYILFTNLQGFGTVSLKCNMATGALTCYAVSVTQQKLKGRGGWVASVRYFHLKWSKFGTIVHLGPKTKTNIFLLFFFKVPIFWTLEKCKKWNFVIFPPPKMCAWCWYFAQLTLMNNYFLSQSCMQFFHFFVCLKRWTL